ncbi:MAG: hypothetical protein WAL59_24870 [Roseiarcus sp.]
MFNIPRKNDEKNTNIDLGFQKENAAILKTTTEGRWRGSISTEHAWRKDVLASPANAPYVKKANHINYPTPSPPGAGGDAVGQQPRSEGLAKLDISQIGYR